MQENDRLIQGMAWSGDFRILAAQTTLSVETARLRSDLSPVAAIAIGRAMTGAILLARLLDKNLLNQYVTLRLDGGGPLGTVLAEGSIDGKMRGFVANPRLGQETLSVGAAIGSTGLLTVVRGAPPSGKPYTSQVRLVSGEIAKDITHYLASSEQISSAVLLSVLVGPAGVEAAGGIVVQAFPHTSPTAIEAMERRIVQLESLGSLLGRHPIEEAVEAIFRGVDYKSIDPSLNVPLQYHCHCTRERALRSFRHLTSEDIDEMITIEGGGEAVCQFCGAKYTFSIHELFEISAEIGDGEGTEN